MTQKRCYEDFNVGEKLSFGAYLVTKEEIITFAKEYDAQPFHIDEEAAKHSYVKTLIASGWHTCGIMMKLMWGAFIENSMSYGAPGIEELKWVKPVKPDDILTLHMEILEKKDMRSRPQMGMFKSKYSLTNQLGETVVECTNWGFMGKKGAEPPQALPDDAGRQTLPQQKPHYESLSLAFDDLKPGMNSVVGSHHFTREEVIRFATQFDPQPFHMTDEGAKASYFGRLSASGWNTASAFMQCMVKLRGTILKEQMKKGEKPKEWGPAAGFKNMKWLRPVYAGDTITYFNEVVDTRPSQSKPDWGLLTFTNKGYNQYGDQVFEFTGTALVKR